MLKDMYGNQDHDVWDDNIDVCCRRRILKQSRELETRHERDLWRWEEGMGHAQGEYRQLATVSNDQTWP